MSNHAKIREAAKKLNPIDDLMFRKMAEDELFCEEILQVILGDSQLKVLENCPQFAGTNLQGRSVIMDVKCRSGQGREINVEVQRENDDNHQKRVRYNGAILTTNLTDPGTKFENLPNVCVVFIARFDIFHGAKSIYHVDRIVRETQEIVDNGFEEIYVNALCRDGSDVSELMEIFIEDDKYSEKYPHTSRNKRLYKETERGQNVMCEIMEKLRAEGVEEGRAEGENRAFVLIQKLLKAGRIEDAEKVAEDPDLKRRLMLEFSLIN